MGILSNYAEGVSKKRMAEIDRQSGETTPTVTKQAPVVPVVAPPASLVEEARLRQEKSREEYRRKYGI